jgi:hypothetical protein
MLAELRYYPEDLCYRIEFMGNHKLLKPATNRVMWASHEHVTLTRNGETFPVPPDSNHVYAVKVTIIKKMKTGVIRKIYIEIGKELITIPRITCNENYINSIGDNWTLSAGPIEW